MQNILLSSNTIEAAAVGDVLHFNWPESVLFVEVPWGAIGTSRNPNPPPYCRSIADSICGNSSREKDKLLSPKIGESR